MRKFKAFTAHDEVQGIHVEELMPQFEMSTAPPPILSYAGELTAPPRPPITWVVRIAYAYAGVIVPLASFGIALLGYPLKPDWQSPRWTYRVAILLDGIIPVAFYPLLAYSMVSMALMVVQPMRWARSPVVRIGLWTGILLALQFAIIQTIAVGKDSNRGEGVGITFVALIVAPLAVLAVWGISLIPFGRLWRTSKALAWIVWIVIALAALAGAGPTIAVSLLCGPAFALAAFGCMSYQAAKLAKYGVNFTLMSRVVLPLTWLAGYVLAWRVTISLAIRAYAKLPPAAPQCYIATAAARGHSWVVLSKETRTMEGEVFCVNDQLRRLKAAEIAMATLLPRAHRIGRAIYDRMGKPAAGAIRHPVVADLAYLTLKPAEWLAIILLKLLPRAVRDCVSQLYSSN